MSTDPEDLATPSNPMQDPVPRSDIVVLSQEIDDEDGMYRIRAGQRVHYLTIQRIPGPMFELLTLCRPYLLIPELPPFPNAPWISMNLFRGSDGTIQHTLSWEPLRSIQPLWHPRRIDVLSLTAIASHRCTVKEVEYDDGQGTRRAVSKVAIFDWRIPQVQREARVYESLAAALDPSEPPLAPRFLGHLMEHDGTRCVGFLLENVDGRYASPADFSGCEAALRRLHRAGWTHGDVNRYNFLVDESTGHVRLLDFEHARPYDEAVAQVELAGLQDALADTSGLGASVMIGEDGTEEIAGPSYYAVKVQGV